MDHKMGYGWIEGTQKKQTDHNSTTGETKITASKPFSLQLA
jgi:hypothetical protein